jgi:hypothetical protein
MDAIQNRRSAGSDRREHNLRAALHSCFRNRRKAVRRTTDSVAGQYMDVHEPSLFAIAVGIALLSTLDAFFTLNLLMHGNQELNPLMNALIKYDIGIFIGAKMAITGLSVVFLVMHKHHLLFNRISGQQILTVCFGIYAALIVYELSMVRHIFFI